MFAAYVLWYYQINVLWVFIPLFQHFYEQELVINKPEELICSAKCEIIAIALLI